MAIAPNNRLHLNSQDITRWDLFACVAGRPEGIALTRLAHILHVDRERSLIVPLGALEDEGLIVCDSRDHYILNNKSQIAKNLRQTLAFALASDCDYNVYFSDKMIAFLKKAYRSDYFNNRDVPPELMDPELLCRLVDNALLLIYSYEPFTGRMVENIFLDGLCDYLKIKRVKSFFFRRKVPLEQFLEGRTENFQDPNSPQLKAAMELFHNKNLIGRNWGLPTLGKEIRESVEKEDSEMFDPSSKACYEHSWEKMHEYSREGRQLTVDMLREYHQLSMANTDFGGIYRDHEVMIANNPNFKPAPINEIPQRLEQLVDYLAQSSPSTFEEALDLCAYAYNEFVHIHPFQDGNSRTARVVLGHMLNLLHMPFEEIPSSFSARFLIVTKGLEKRNDKEVKYVLEEIYLNCMNRKELSQVIN
ncbi:MAG: Fic family protein [Candidatus Bruticola sp.]